MNNVDSLHGPDFSVQVDGFGESDRYESRVRTDKEEDSTCKFLQVPIASREGVRRAGAQLVSDGECEATKKW